MRQRRWPGTGMIESFDIRQQRLLDLILEKVRHYWVQEVMAISAIAVSKNVALLIGLVLDSA